jgi:hypothetical protein
MVCPTGTEKMPKKWSMHWLPLQMLHNGVLFCFKRGNKTYYSQLKLVEKLDDNLGTPKVYIVDKNEIFEVEN